MSPEQTDLRMTAGTLARKDVVTVSPDASVREVAQAMFDQTVGSVVVVENTSPAGIVTDRDLAVELLVEDSDVNLFDSGVDVSEITAEDVMTADLFIAESDDELPRVLHHMNEANARRIPVVDADGRVAGILTLDDIVVHIAGESAHVAAQLDSISGVIRSESPD